MDNVTALFEHITSQSYNRKEDVESRFDEQIYDYLPDDWEEEFGDEWEAYNETGRGEAESDIIAELVEDGILELGIGIPQSRKNELFTKLMKHYFDIG